MKKSLFDIKRPDFQLLIILISITIIGVIGIPFGDPRFVIYAVILELIYASLAILIAKGYRKPIYVCIFLAIVIVVGNSFVNAHLNRIMTFSRPFNSLVLILGGYILQGILIYTSVRALRITNGSKSIQQ